MTTNEVQDLQRLIRLRQVLREQARLWLTAALYLDPRHAPTHRAMAHLQHVPAHTALGEFYLRTGQKDRYAYHKRFVLPG